METHVNKSKIILALSLALMSGHSIAGGILLYEIATDNVGLANAGAAARAQGPSTIASNPAGLSFTKGTELSVGAQVLYGDLNFDNDSGGADSGSGSSGNVLNPIPSGSFFLSHQFNDQWSAGLGVYGDFGLSQKYNGDWAGRYFIQKASISGMSVVPTVAYRIDEHWSLGMGLKAMYGQLESQAAIDQSPYGFSKRGYGHYEYKDQTWGYGVNLGMIFSPQEGTRIGLAWTSQVMLEFEDNLKVNGNARILNDLNGLNTQLSVRVPQTTTLSLYRQLDPQWAFLASLNWQDWSKSGDVGIEIDPVHHKAINSTAHANYKDTYQIAVGAQYQYSPEWLFNMGLAYDTSAVSDADRTLTMPLGPAVRAATGVTWQWASDVSFNISWVSVWMGDMPVEQDKSLTNEHISGSFKDAWIQAISASMNWQF